MQLTQLINQQFINGVKKFFSTCEQGAELWAAEIITARMITDSEIELNCLLPSEEQPIKWCLDNQEQYFKVLEDCSRVRYLSKHPIENGLDISRKKLIDMSSNVVAVVPRNKTFPVLEYAKYKNREITYLYVDSDSTVRSFSFAL